MKNLMRCVAASALFLFLSGFQGPKASDILGTWAGEYTSLDHSVPFKVHFWENDDGLRGTMDLSDADSKNHPLQWVIVEENSIHFELVRDSGTLVFDGELKNGRISGDLLFSNVRGKFQLTPAHVATL